MSRRSSTISLNYYDNLDYFAEDDKLFEVNEYEQSHMDEWKDYIEEFELEDWEKMFILELKEDEESEDFY